MRRDSPHDFVFYAPAAEKSSPRVDLTGDEHHHLRRVLRMSPGETVFASNGRGAILECRIEAIDPRVTRTAVVRVVADRPARPLTLALATLKKDAYEDAVRQCTELGITHFTPFVAAKSHVKEYSDAYLERLRRIALSAMKQSFGATLPVVERPVTFDTLHDAIAASPAIVADADAPRLAPGARSRPLVLVVGPEAGLAPDERERLAAAGCEMASISTRRLRAETAAALLTGLVAG
jgi:16S rRNA (uracil1498-N3)-methyltransferase